MKVPHLITLTLSLASLIGINFVTAQDSKGRKRDPFVLDPKANADSNAERSIGILLEYFKVDHITANRLVSQYSPRATDAQDLRDALQSLIDEGQAELYETAWINARSGNRAKTESIREFIYPTEYDPAEIPNAIGNASTSASKESKTKEGEKETESKTSRSSTSTGGIPDIHMTPLTPTAFKVRNVGMTLEVDPVLSSNNRIIDLNLAPELVVRLEDQQMARKGFEETAKGLEHVWMPTFFTIKNTTQITIIDGNYCLFGIHGLPDDPKSKIIAMLRADVIVIK